MIKIEVYDTDLVSRDHIGNFETSIAKIMGSSEQRLTSDLYLPGKTKSRGKIILNLEKVTTSNDMIYFDLEVKNLKSTKTFLCGSDDPFFFIERSRTVDSKDFLRVVESEKV